MSGPPGIWTPPGIGTGSLPAAAAVRATGAASAPARTRNVTRRRMQSSRPDRPGTRGRPSAQPGTAAAHGNGPLRTCRAYGPVLDAPDTAVENFRMIDGGRPAGAGEMARPRGW